MGFPGYGRPTWAPAAAAGATLALAAAAALALAPSSPAGAATPAAGVPIADGHVTTDGPRRGWAVACARPGHAAAQRHVPWIRRGRYLAARKPVIDGAVRWPFASFSRGTGAGGTALEGNGMPVGTVTGVFPPARTDDAAPYAGGAAALVPQKLGGALARTPRLQRRPTCVGSTKPVGVARNGIPILPAFGAGGIDAAAHEVQDRCGGRTDGQGLYFYRSALPCLLRGASLHHPSPLVGWARDGFPIYGPRGEHGRLLTDKDLDACHGRTSEVTYQGRRRRIYHYHLTAEFPYVVGCFRGTPAKSWQVTALPASVPSVPGPVQISTQPSLFPAFDPAVSDYVTRCGSDPVAFSVDAPPGVQVSVDGQPARGGAFSAQVSLTAGQRASVSVSAGASAGTYNVRCLPQDFPAWSAQRSGTPQAQWYLVTPTINFTTTTSPYVALFDGFGVPVWWMRTAVAPTDAKVLPDGNLAWARLGAGSFGTDPTGRYEEHRLDGSLVRTYATVATVPDYHDMQVMPTGDVLMLSYVPRDGVDLRPFGGPNNATVLDAEVQEISPAGSLVWSWNSKDHIALSETGAWWSSVLSTPTTLPDNRTAYDIVHVNAVEPDGDGVVVSFRHLDAVYRIDRASGGVVWKLGGTARAQSLTVLGDDAHSGANTFHGQHDARVLPGGELSVYDNGTSVRPPRIVRYRIDAGGQTATLLEQQSVPEAGGSVCCGSNRRLPGGDWVTAWTSSPLVTEIAPDGHRVLTLTFGNGTFSYRAVPVLAGVLDVTALRAGMDVMHPR